MCDKEKQHGYPREPVGQQKFHLMSLVCRITHKTQPPSETVLSQSTLPVVKIDYFFVI